MNDWRAGYVTDLGYTFGYYPELNPLRIRLAFLNQGLVFPQVGSACELGFGQGVSTNLHASASVTQWCGTDFNPSQAGFAQELAASSGAGALLAGDAFADFALRTDLPDFDFLALHGIWSWISDDNRRVIVDFVRRKLKVGGVLYISYNTLPGWSNFLSVRHLMAEHARVLGASGETIKGRIHKALGFAQQVMDTEPLALMTAPGAAEQLRKMQSLDPHYIAHEFFNRDWQPMHFSTVAQWLEGAKLQFACSASYMDAAESMHLTAEQLKSYLEQLRPEDFGKFSP
jgi:SAM-dependent methyltransferase